MLPSCCLNVVAQDQGTGTGGGPGVEHPDTGYPLDSGPEDHCDGVYCAPAFACDPIDGLCKCGGQICETGDCDPDGGICGAGCTLDGGDILLTDGPRLSSGNPPPGSAYAVVLPTATRGAAYNTALAAYCAVTPPTFQALSQVPAGLTLYLPGVIEGVPSQASAPGIPFEFEASVIDSLGRSAVQNFLLTVDSQ